MTAINHFVPRPDGDEGKGTLQNSIGSSGRDLEPCVQWKVVAVEVPVGMG